MDESGKRGDEPGFDKSKIKVYGLGLDGGSGGGRRTDPVEHVHRLQQLAVHRQEPWGTHYNYDQPAFQQTIGWFRSLIEKGYMPSVEAVTGQSFVGHLRRRQVRHDHQRLVDDQPASST